MLTKRSRVDVVYGSCFGGSCAVKADPGLSAFAARAKQVVSLDPDYRYIRVRAIGNLEVDGANNNFDAFPYGELDPDEEGYGYKTFENRDAFVEHSSYDIANSIGYLPAAYLNAFNMDKYSGEHWSTLGSSERIEILAVPDQNDGSVEVLMAIDSTRAPVIARKIEKKEPVGVSMGTNIRYSVCSVCGNRAETEAAYCNCVKFSKGGVKLVPANQTRDLLTAGALRPEWLKWVLRREGDQQEVLNGSSNRMVVATVFEINHGLQFFELSVVANPAYTRGHMLERVAKEKKFSSQIDWGKYSDEQLLEVLLFVDDAQPVSV